MDNYNLYHITSLSLSISLDEQQSISNSYSTGARDLWQ